jgi:hypothetical protein
MRLTRKPKVKRLGARCYAVTNPVDDTLTLYADSIRKLSREWHRAILASLPTAATERPTTPTSAST